MCHRLVPPALCTFSAAVDQEDHVSRGSFFPESTLIRDTLYQQVSIVCSGPQSEELSFDAQQSYPDIVLQTLQLPMLFTR